MKMGRPMKNDRSPKYKEGRLPKAYVRRKALLLVFSAALLYATDTPFASIV